MSEHDEIENKTNKTFGYCGRFPTITDGVVYRHRKTRESHSEISSSRNRISINGIDIDSQKELDDLILMLLLAWEEHKILKRFQD